MEGTETHSLQTEKDITKIFIDKDRLRVETLGLHENMVIIFRNDKNLFWMVDMDKEEYRELTKEDLKKMKAKIDESMKMMQEQMKNLPPEQRKMMEKMMPANMSTQKPEKPVFTKKASGVKIKQWNCSHFEGMVDGVKKQEVWTVDWSQIGIDAKEMKALSGMGEFFESISPEMADLFSFGDKDAEKKGGFSGMPVKTIDYDEGKKTSVFELNKIENKSFESTVFNIPAGFEKVSGEWE